MGTAGTKGVPRAEREQQLLDIAGEQISHAGYAGLSPGAVAAAVGVSKPLVFHYFHSKEGLYAACVERAADTVCGAIESVFDGSPGIAMAERTLEVVIGVLARRPHDWNVLLDTSHPVHGVAADAAHQARRRIADQAQRGAAALLAERGITDAADLSALTDVWMGVVTAMVNWWLRHPDESADAMIARCRRLMGALFWSGPADGQSPA
ncbi:TetR/AcrR family transcriptional regulator [Nocardia sp. NPDC060259]|uniref:TetR/AcrR family transcriptional regulator n=1 Tax=Nocardia sp. NPDC060259 TaxID=3347088 RepID=UPI003663039A